MSSFKPMLAGKCTDVSRLRYPVMCTPKLDGIRCLKRDGKAVTRSLKPIPNISLRHRIERDFPDGIDCELMVPGLRLNQVSSIVMTRDCVSSVVEHWTFDLMDDCPTVPYNCRMNDLDRLVAPPGMRKLLPVTICNSVELVKFEEKCLVEGYEGIIIRSPGGPYKFGRSTEKEGYFLKLKRFEDSEAVIIGFEEKVHNDNVLIGDELHTTKRHTYKEGMIPMGVLGALLCTDEKHAWTLSVGSGFDDEQRAEIWTNRKKYLGKVVKYRFQPYGCKDGPRFPTFIGLRDERDM